MKDSPAQEHSSAKLLSFSRLAAIIVGAYCVANLLVIILLLAHAIPSPLDVLFCLSLVGPAALALIILVLWCDTRRPGRSGPVLALLMFGAIVIAVLNLRCFTSAIASV